MLSPADDFLFAMGILAEPKESKRPTKTAKKKPHVPKRHAPRQKHNMNFVLQKSAKTTAAHPEAAQEASEWAEADLHCLERIDFSALLDEVECEQNLTGSGFVHNGLFCVS